MTRPTIWFTGLSLSGKTTLAERLAEALRQDGHAVEVLDGKIVREELAGFFGYSREERIKVSRVLATMAKLLARNGVVPIVTSITPHQESRDYNRRELPGYLEVFLDCSVETCAARDSKGLYQRAIRGDVKHFVGVSDPYEIPRQADLRLSTDGIAPDASAGEVIAFVRSRLAPPTAP